MRRYSSRQSVSFGRSAEYARRRQGVIIAVLAGVLAAGVLVYFLILAPTVTTKGDLRQKYLETMSTELKLADDKAKNLSQSNDRGSYVPAAIVRSHVQGVIVLYDLYLEAGGSEIEGFSSLNNVLSLTDQYVTNIQDGGSTNAKFSNTTTDILLSLETMRKNLSKAMGIPE